MSRLNVVDPNAATGAIKEVFEGPLKGKHFNIYKGMANSPAVMQAYLGFSGNLGEGALSKKEAEVIALTVGEANGCDYCTAAHSMIGKMAGLSDEQIIGARQGSVANDPKLDALAHFATAMHEKKGYVSDDDLAKVRAAGYTDEHITEAVAHYALATFTNYFNHVNKTDVDFPAAPKIG